MTREERNDKERATETVQSTCCCSGWVMRERIDADRSTNFGRDTGSVIGKFLRVEFIGSPGVQGMNAWFRHSIKHSKTFIFRAIQAGDQALIELSQQYQLINVVS